MIKIIDDFLPLEVAFKMRNGIDRHFRNQERHTAHEHQIWNYWHIPDMYTYMRTDPHRIFGQEEIATLRDTLGAWTQHNLGMDLLHSPYLSMYINGCRQGWHNDATNGRFAYVYSLTNNERRTTGGETMILHEGNPFLDNLNQPAAGTGIYDAVAPRFNRLVIFDDRLVHAVSMVEGSMDPLEGRFVLHGHMKEAPTRVVGPLSVEEVTYATSGIVDDLLVNFGEGCFGPLVLRFTVEPDGHIGDFVVLVNRVIDIEVGVRDEELSWLMEDKLREAQFPEHDTSSEVTLPIMFKG
jgi:hypothetical protein